MDRFPIVRAQTFYTFPIVGAENPPIHLLLRYLRLAVIHFEGLARLAFEGYVIFHTCIDFPYWGTALVSISYSEGQTSYTFPIVGARTGPFLYYWYVLHRHRCIHSAHKVGRLVLRAQVAAGSAWSDRLFRVPRKSPERSQWTERPPRRRSWIL